MHHEDTKGTKFFLQDDRDFCGGGRFAGVALRLPGDQDSFGLCGASTSRANPAWSGDFVALRSLVWVNAVAVMGRGGHEDLGGGGDLD